MLSWWMSRQIDRFEQDFDYDMAYGRDLLATSTRAAMLFFRATAIGKYREGVSKDAWYAAKLVVSRDEDCGPCTQLNATLAERDGVPEEVVRAVLRKDFDGMPDDVVLSVRFTNAVLRRDPAANELRAAVVERFGRHGLVSLSFAMIAARMYPILKYALGHGHACSVVHVAGTPVFASREAL
jgi:hypothetical protein